MSQSLGEKLREAFEKFPYETHQLFLRNYIPIAVDPYSLQDSQPSESFSEEPSEGEITLTEDLYDKNTFINLLFSGKSRAFVLKKDGFFRRVFGPGRGFLSKTVEIRGEVTLMDDFRLNGSGLASELEVFYVKGRSRLKHLRKVEGSGNLLYNAYYFIEEGAAVEVYSLASGKMYVRDRILSFNAGYMSSFTAKAGYDLDESSSVDSEVVMKLMAPRSSADAYQRSLVRRYSKVIHKGLVVNTREAPEGRSFIEQKALLLSKEGSAQNIPGMELEINDIYAKHAAAVFPIDENQLFYLMSRGLSRESSIELIARNMLRDIREVLGLENEP